MTTATLTTTRLQERIAAPHGRVDRENGIVYGVKILGRISRNNREYTAEAIAKAAGLYEGVAVFADHTGRAGQTNERSVRDKIGWLSGVKVVAESLVGNLHLLLTDPLAAKILEVAEKNPRQLGLSHVAEGVTRREGGRLIVEEIKSVRSVDIVTDPATTSGLFESMSRRDEYPADPRAFVRALTEATAYGSLRSDSANGGMITPGDNSGESDTSTVDGTETAGDRIARAIREVAQRKDLAIELRSDLILKLAELDGPNNAELEKRIQSILAAIPSENEVRSMQSPESFSRCVTIPSGGYGGVRLTEAKGKGAGKGAYPKDQRGFVRSIT
ncbi:MAG: hypothetical protein KJZ87_06060 [Thermoguttaceae bacterium]|nr:hypothetical protein [Thermoguttaceae bacterium]